MLEGNKGRELSVNWLEQFDDFRGDCWNRIWFVSSGRHYEFLVDALGQMPAYTWWFYALRLHMIWDYSVEWNVRN